MGGKENKTRGRISMKFIGDPNDLYKEILSIVRNSKEYLYIVSPYIGFEKDSSHLKAFKNAFREALKRNVNISIITRGRDPQAPPKNIYIIRDFLDYQDHIFLVPYLHSKIYCNESSVLITSLNLSISSLFNQNHESGVVLTRKNSIEAQEHEKIISYIESLKYRAN